MVLKYLDNLNKINIMDSVRVNTLTEINTVDCLKMDN